VFCGHCGLGQPDGQLSKSKENLKEEFGNCLIKISYNLDALSGSHTVTVTEDKLFLH